MAVAFEHFVDDYHYISPACSVTSGASVKIVFDEKHLKYPHSGYTAISKAFDPNRIIHRKQRILYPEISVPVDQLQEENKYDTEGVLNNVSIASEPEEKIEIVCVDHNAKTSTEPNNNDIDHGSEFADGWATAYQDGRVFYQNNITKQTQWDKPMISSDELPYGWKTAYTKDGKLYYQNDLTKETQWEKPIATIQNELPTGWRSVYSADGKVYYQNDITKQTQWTKPIIRIIKQNDNVLTNEKIKQSVRILSDALSARFNHSGFDINEYIYIHGGACRDIVLNKADNIKDIDLFVELNKIHIHASECKHYGCVLSSAYNTNKHAYEAIWKMCTQSFIWRHGREHKQQGGVLQKHHNPEERKGIELLVMSICHEFVTSDCIINTKYLLKEAIKDTMFTRDCRTIKGPNPKSLNVVTYTLHLKNGVDLDIMDCSVFISYYHAVQILRYFHQRHEYLKEVNEYKHKAPSPRFVYPITHEDKVKYVDCTINAICIKLSSVIGVDVRQWQQHVMEPYSQIKTCHKSMDAINDLRQSILRPYYDSERARESFKCVICCKGIRSCLLCWRDSDELMELAFHDVARSESILGSVSSTAESGQAELLIFRIMKAAHKLKDQVKPIKISSKYCDVMENTYAMWFDANKLLNGVQYNKSKGKEENKLDAVLRHVFNHNYFRNGKIAQSYVVGIYHILKYDKQLVEYYDQYEAFRSKLDEAVQRYDAQTLWNEIQKCAKSNATFYPMDGGRRLFEVVKH
eukprot:161183_1